MSRRGRELRPETHTQEEIEMIWEVAKGSGTRVPNKTKERGKNN